MTPATFVHTCSDCGTSLQASAPPDDEKSFCKACFRQHLNNIEREVLEDYLSFASSARRAAAALLLDFFERSADPRLRKFVALKLFEEVMLATEDLAMLYIALSDRGNRPVLE